MPTYTFSSRFASQPASQPMPIIYGVCVFLTQKERAWRQIQTDRVEYMYESEWKKENQVKVKFFIGPKINLNTHALAR